MASLAEFRAQYPQYADMDDASLAGALHQKFYADMPRAEFDKRMGVAPAPAKPAKEDDVYTATARREMQEQAASGAPQSSPSQRLFVHGATLGASDEIMAGLHTPLEMIKRGTFNPAEGFRYAKARENLELEQAREKGGVGGTVAEVGGGVLSGTGLARAGLSALRFLRPNSGLAARSGVLAADSAATGAVTGALEGEGLEDRMNKATGGAALGAVLGGALPVAGTVANAAAAPVISNIRARINPEGVARTQLARALAEGNQTPRQVADDVAAAAREGQDMFTLADAMGNPGQRMLATVTKAPGPGRTEAVEFLDQRQAGQGRRIANILAEGFDSPRTAAQTRDALTTQRRADGNLNYGEARAQAGVVDVSPAIAQIDRVMPQAARMFQPQPGMIDDSVEGILGRARSFLTDGRSQISEFDKAHRVKMELDLMIDRAPPTLQRVLIPVRNALDDQLAAASEPYALARQVYRQQSEAIEAVDQGRNAALRGRTEDVIPEFRGMRADQQEAYRSGYVDPLIEQAQGAAYGANKARPLTSDAFIAESQAIAPNAPAMTRRIDRENTMFRTRTHATGGSPTAENLADMDAMRVDPSTLAMIMGNIGSGNWGGAARNLLTAGSNALSGYTPEVRQQLARLLLQRRDASGVTQLLQNEMDAIARRQAIAAQLARGGMVGTSVAAQ